MRRRRTSPEEKGLTETGRPRNHVWSVYHFHYLASEGSVKWPLCDQGNSWENSYVLKIPERQLELAKLCHQYTALSLGELWLLCFALGSSNTLLQLDAFLHGALRPTPHEFNLIAVALNEHFIEIEMDQFVPYVEGGFAS